MKKYLILIGIIAVCLMSFKSSASYQNPVCKAMFYIDDPYYYAGCTYDFKVEVISLYPTDGYSQVFNTSYANTWLSLPANTIVNGVWYVEPTTPDYYTMIIWVSKNNGAWRYGRSNAWFSYSWGTYYLNSVNNITIPIDY
jgi:hypothetical protein